MNDLATYANLTEVIVAERARGQGIGSWMVAATLYHPDVQGPASVYIELRPR